MNKEKKRACKEAGISYITAVFSLLFLIPITCGSAIGLIGLPLYRIPYCFLIFIPIGGLIGIYYLSFRRIFRHIIVRRKGEVITGTVVKYYDNDFYRINESPVQTLSIRLNTKDGNKRIYYETFETSRDYEVGSEIELYRYKDIYLIKNRRKNKKESLIITAIFIAVAICLIIFSWIFTKYYLFVKYGINIDHEIEMKNIENNNKEIKTKLNNLYYEIPDGYKLDNYVKNSRYTFIAKTKEHNCEIEVYSYERINPDEEYVSEGCDIPLSPETTNLSSWCRKTSYDYENPSTIYEKVEDGYYYRIRMYNYKDEDEFCSVSFSNFKDSIK